MKEIKKILIANRGEIACRVIRTCQEMDIETVTIYADDDADLLHASLSTESYALGSGALSDTYLNQDKLIEIAKKSGAQAIHPGYGFLSENTSFCKRVTDEGLIFIGPSPEAIELMGDKKASKQQVEKINGPLIPGYHGDKQDVATLKAEAKKIGYPVLVKATAGGGGKGMRIINSDSEFEEGLNSAKSEALKAFANDQVLIEKYITKPRHIEVQVFGDQHGNYIHFYERECSIQRRYQKIVEETPSPALDQEGREKICAAAVDIAKSINYEGAGTVEFIYDEDGSFYFLEMNTRLQVEHPITEMVTGVDLVRLQIDVAQGYEFAFTQEDITQDGHAIELRYYAEDPWNNFLPTIGNILNIGESELDDVRLDCGYMNGNEVTINYDPMIAKLVTWAADRESCVKKTKQALADYTFHGIVTNREYLKKVLEHPKFLAGETFTSFISEYENEIKSTVMDTDVLADDIAAFLLHKKFSDVGPESAAWEGLKFFRNV